MTGYLLDTNVLSEVLKKRPEPKVLSRLREARGEICTSVVCLLELRYGAVRRDRSGTLWRRIEEEVLPPLTLLSLAAPEAIRAGDILAELESKGEKIGIEDVLIAATALSHDLTVSSRNVKHLRRIRGLDVEDWWQ